MPRTVILNAATFAVLACPVLAMLTYLAGGPWLWWLVGAAVVGVVGWRATSESQCETCGRLTDCCGNCPRCDR